MPPPISLVPATRYGVSSSTIRCQYRWCGYLLFDVTFCRSVTASRSDSGTSPSEKPFRPPELPYTVWPSGFSATSSTVKRWLLLAICPAVRCSSSCVGCSGSAPARFCISCSKARSTASCVRVSTDSRFSQYAIPDADTAAVSATRPNTTTSRRRRLVKRSRDQTPCAPRTSRGLPLVLLCH